MAAIDSKLNYQTCAGISPCGRFIGASGFTAEVRFWEVLFSAPTDPYVRARSKVKTDVVLPEDEQPENAGRVLAVFREVCPLRHIFTATSLNNTQS